MKKARISDVAKLAGVSPSTVTRVIHEKGYVSTENRLKVVNSLEALGYFPNIQARSLRNRRSYTIGLLLSSERTNPFYTNVADAIRTASAQRGYSILSTNHSFSAKAEEAAVRQFTEHAVEAVIVCHALQPENFAPLRRANIPIIQVERNRLAETHQIEIDLHPGFDKGIDVLVAQGHRQIAFIGWMPRQDYLDPDISVTELKRSEGFRGAVARRNLRLEDCPVLLGNYDVERGPFEIGRTLADTLLNDNSPPVTAIMTGSDVLAAGVLQALYARRIRVPDDISVIGYDDSMAACLSPPLTTIAQPYTAIAYAALDILERCHVEPDQLAPIRAVVANKLLERESTAAAHPNPANF